MVISGKAQPNRRLVQSWKGTFQIRADYAHISKLGVSQKQCSKCGKSHELNPDSPHFTQHFLAFQALRSRSFCDCFFKFFLCVVTLQRARTHTHTFTHSHNKSKITQTFWLNVQFVWPLFNAFTSRETHKHLRLKRNTPVLRHTLSPKHTSSQTVG